MGRYEKYVYELQSQPEIPGLSRRDSPKAFTIEWGGKFYPEATMWFSVNLINRPGTTYVPGRRLDLTKIPKELKYWLPVNEDETVLRSAPMYHVYEEYFLFHGTNPDDAKDLGGEIELWLGAGDTAEKIMITKPSCVYIPAGLVHCPLVFKKVDRPIVEIIIYPKPILIEERIDLYPPGYKGYKP
jgi:hypothetical protein